MAGELGWDARRQAVEWKDTVAFLASMGLAKSKLGVTRRDVEMGRAGEYDEYERKLYSRHDAPADTLASDSKFAPGEKLVVGRDSPANK